MHGYDLTCCTALSGHRLVSGAEEKVLRAFTCPSTFLANLALVTGEEVAEEEVAAAVAQGASVPSLGLSNKAVYQGEEGERERHVKDLYPDSYFSK